MSQQVQQFHTVKFIHEHEGCKVTCLPSFPHKGNWENILLSVSFVCMPILYKELWTNLFHAILLTRICFYMSKYGLQTLIIKQFSKIQSHRHKSLDKQHNAYRWENKKHDLKWPHCSSSFLVISKAIQDVKQTLTTLG
jgi:hypothetical protein